MDQLNKNPELFKGNFYTQNYIDQVAKTQSTSKTSFKYLDNPYKKQENDERDFQLRVQQFLQKGILDQANYNLDVEKLNIERIKAEKSGESDSSKSSGLLRGGMTDN